MKTLALVGAIAAAVLSGCASSADIRKRNELFMAPARAGDVEGTLRAVAAHPNSGTIPNVDLAMMGAVYASRMPVIEALLAKGADAGQALATAAGHGNLKLVQFFLSRGASLEGGAGGRFPTPLMEAARNGQLDVVSFLAAKGASRTATYSGMTAYDYAVHDHQSETARYLDPKGGGASLSSVPSHGNLDDAGYARMRAAASLPPEPTRVSVDSDADLPTRRGAPRPDDFALVIGIEEYQSVPKAEWGARDAQAVRRHLEAMGFPPRNVISLEGSQATGNKLKSYLEEWLPLNVKPASTLFVYYSGHGAPDPKSGEAYLLPWDGDAAFLKSTAYPIKKLYADLARIKAKRVIVALDACFSGAGGRSVLAQGARPLVTKTEDLKPAGAVTVLAASSGDEITGSLSDQRHGMFTYFLLKGLDSGLTSAKELMEYVSPRVQDEARRQNRQQTPVLIGEDAKL